MTVAEMLGHSHFSSRFAFSSRLWYSRDVHSSNPDPEIRPDGELGEQPDDRRADLPEPKPSPPEVKAITTEAIKDAVIDPRRDWHLIERLVRDYVKILKEQGLRPERAVSEAKALVVAATGDPMSTILPSVVTWTLSEYYDRSRG